MVFLTACGTSVRERVAEAANDSAICTELEIPVDSAALSGYRLGTEAPPEIIENKLVQDFFNDTTIIIKGLDAGCGYTEN